MKRAKQFVVLVGIIAVSFITLGGCQIFRGKSGGNESTATQPQSSGSLATYYDFKDVLIPGEMSLDAKRRSVYTDARVAAGVLVFEGRVEARSLATFFEEKMPQDGWRLIHTFRQQKDYHMSFQKEGAFCQISIYDGQFTTQVEVRRSPLISTSEPLGKRSQTESISPPPPPAADSAPKPRPPTAQPLR